MDNIIEPNNSFNFSQISLAQPVAIQGNAYFTKILSNNKSLYIQTPKSFTKQGFIKSGKKMYCDLMFDNTHEEFIQWIEHLEERSQDLLYDKSSSWFQNPLEKDDIETAFSSALKIYKSGKNYLLRVNVKTNNTNGSPIIKIFNENETVMSVEDVTQDTNIVSIIEIQGIKFSTRNFQIEMELKQVMIMNTDLIFESCIIKKNNNKSGLLEFNKDKEDKNNEENVGKIMKTEPNKIVLDKTDIISKQILEDLEEEPNVKQIDKIVEQISLDIIDSNKNAQSDVLEEFDDAILATIDSKSETITLVPKKYGSDDEEEDEEEEDEEDDDEEDDEIKLEVEDLDGKQNESDFSEMKEFDLSISNDNLETMTLKKPNEVYYEIYKEARKKAKEAKQAAILAYLEAKNIKKTYMLDEIESSDDSDDHMNSDFSDEDDDYEEKYE